MVRKYFIELSYLGTNYSGWQVQKNTKHTVQQVMEENLSRLLNEKISLLGCGRTDTGVHATRFFAHLETAKNLGTLSSHSSGEKIQQGADWVFKFNSVLPKDIAVHNIFLAGPKAHARFDAVSRTYKYFIAFHRDPFLDGRVLLVPGDLDMDKMNKASEELLRHEDFTSFSKARTQVKTNICKIKEAGWEKIPAHHLPGAHGSHGQELLLFTITSDRFLRGMVRAIVGTMLDIGKGKKNVGEMKRIIEGRHRSKAGMNALACGLYLTDVKYPEGIFL